MPSTGYERGKMHQVGKAVYMCKGVLDLFEASCRNLHVKRVALDRFSVVSLVLKLVGSLKLYHYQEGGNINSQAVGWVDLVR